MNHKETNMPYMIFANISYGGGYDKNSLSTHSPFFGTTPTKWKPKRGDVRTDLWRKANDIGCDHPAVNAICSFLSIDGKGDKEDIVDVWVRICKELPLMLHLVPEEIAPDQRIEDVRRLLFMGDVKWSHEDVVRCVRAVLIADGFDRIESRTVISNEYDDQSYSDHERTAYFLMREVERVGFSGIQIGTAHEEDDPYLALMFHVQNKSGMRDSDYEGNSFLYYLISDICHPRDLASGINLGR